MSSKSSKSSMLSPVPSKTSQCRRRWMSLLLVSPLSFSQRDESNVWWGWWGQWVESNVVWWGQYMFDPQELLMESEKLMADQTEEAVLMEELSSTIDQPQNPAAKPEIDKAESSDGDDSLWDDLFKDIPIAYDQLQELDKWMADQTEEAESLLTIDQPAAVEIQKAVDAHESSSSDVAEFFWWDDMLKDIPLSDKISPSSIFGVLICNAVYCN
ncbi:hypothetical protein LWI29_015333 [Acer saccharum]|uniref:Uncharacterized protein n=1 Tax=Acer saccharum TaxID=4024 RepID=A0AA39S393_ACESA|nr:hypothetical protein LWI29_015333 [Acer saccharum]